jgi:hypothetical protein
MWEAGLLLGLLGNTEAVGDAMNQLFNRDIPG